MRRQNRNTRRYQAYYEDQTCNHNWSRDDMNSKICVKCKKRVETDD